MMGRQSGQISMLVLDIKEQIPENHLLRQINQLVSFDFIYDLAAPYYPASGRPSVDPVSMFKMLLVGYLYGIKSERRLVQEVQLNIAYRWFCGFELGEKIPDHSTFSKTRVRKWNESSFFPASIPGDCSSLHRTETDRWQGNGLGWQLYPRRSFPKQLDRHRGRSRAEYAELSRRFGSRTCITARVQEAPDPHGHKKDHNQHNRS